MTEAEWLACRDPVPMLTFLRDRASERKLLLFSCACHRRTSRQDDDDPISNIVEVEEQYADRQATFDDVEEAYVQAGGECSPYRTYDWQNAEDDCIGSCMAGQLTGVILSEHAEFAAQVHLLRCIFNPFRLVAVDPAWFSWKEGLIPKLAQRIYDNRAFDQLRILADALESAGCTNADILRHCREPGEHVRGCWVVDLILGKS